MKQILPELPDVDAEIEIPAQPSPYHGERTIKVYVRYPDGSRAAVNAETGVMLSLHNWGGTGFIGTADPAVLCAGYNVVTIGVDYLQSGQGAPPADGHPYDTGYLQALDALRALHFVLVGLRAAGCAFAADRCYTTGGSGGGNVSLMANKLAPRTFAAVVDLSGLASLTDEVAFDASPENDVYAGYRSDPEHPHYLPLHAQQIRDVGFPEHAQIMRRLGNAATIISVHGVEDRSCPIADKKRVLGNLGTCGLRVIPHYLTPAEVDGELIRDCGHSIGNRTQLVMHFADTFLRPGGPEMCRLTEPSDFDCADDRVRYPVAGGRYVIDYTGGAPVGRFEAD